MLRRDTTRLLLVLWASLVSGEFARDMILNRLGVQNLSCFQCFSVPSANMCHPADCLPKDKLCVSRETELYSDVIDIQRLYRVTKYCDTTCPNIRAFSDGRMITKSVRCCSWNRCNRAPESWEGFWSLPVKLLLPMGLFCTLL